MARPIDRSRRRLRPHLFAGVAIATLCSTSPALGQQTPAPDATTDHVEMHQSQNTPVQTAPPPGFEDLDTAVTTLFDLTFQDRKIGAFSATFKDGKLTFTNPAAVAAALGTAVDTAAVTSFLSQPLVANEQYRCRPGQSPNSGCGLLPGDTPGVIVNTDTFDISLFLTRQFLVGLDSGPQYLGPAMAGPSLIQGIRFSAASAGGNGSVRYGGVFDTLASVGNISVVAQTALSDNEGLRAQQLYAQRIWSDRRAAAGLLQDFQSLTLNQYRVAGAEFGSFYGTMLDADNSTATPVQIVLPRRAQVEIYRDGVLMQAGQYDAGLQLIDTKSLPQGSYSIHIVARDGPSVLIDETRSFSKLGTLVPPGKTAFQVRLGERVADILASPDSTSGQYGGFLPPLTHEFVASGSAQRRLGRSLVGGLTVTSFDSRVFSEASFQVYRGKVSGLVGGGVGADGTYSAIVSGSLQLNSISFYLSGRKTHADRTINNSPFLNGIYEPYYRSEDTIFGSIQMHVFDGSMTMSGSYSRESGLPDRYALGIQYSRSFRLPLIGSALLTASAEASDFDKRVGLTISFFKQIDSHTDAAFTAGGQYVRDRQGSARTGVSPVAEAIVTRTDRVGTVDVVSQAGGSTDADSDRAFAEIRGQSSYGEADASAQYQTRTFGGNNLSYLFNAQTGFAVGGGAIKIGLQNPDDAVVLLDLRDIKSPKRPSSSPAGGATAIVSSDGGETAKVAQGGYRVTIDSKPYDYIRPGSRVAIGLPALKQYQVGLKAEDAPQFDLSGTEQKITLYPGNVVRVKFDAQRVVSLFGQLLEADGTPLRGARVSAGNDFVVADDNGYFTITAPVSASLEVKRDDGSSCLVQPLGSLIRGDQPTILYRVGKVRCGVATAPVAAAAPPGAGGETSRSNEQREPLRRHPAGAVKEKLDRAKAEISALPD